MPNHTTWFNFIIPHFKELLAAFRERAGLSFIDGTPVEIQYVIGWLFVAVLLLSLAVIVWWRIADTKRALVPDDRLTIRTFFETVVEAVLKMMEGSMPREAATFFLPLIGTCGLLILFSNLLGLLPGFLPPTGTLNTTVPMALIVFTVTHVYGVRAHGLKYFAHWFGPIRKWWAAPLMLLLFGIELVSHLARPISLSVRLMGNMFADHMVLTMFTTLVPILVPLPMLLLGVLVCLVQTAVFCILSTVYIGMAIAHEEE